MRFTNRNYYYYYMTLVQTKLLDFMWTPQKLMHEQDHGSDLIFTTGLVMLEQEALDDIYF